MQRRGAGSNVGEKMSVVGSTTLGWVAVERSGRKAPRPKVCPIISRVILITGTSLGNFRTSNFYPPPLTS